MDKERFLQSGLIEQYVLGITSPEENEEVERFADQYPEIRSEIRQLQQAMEEYARQYAIPPPDGVREQVMSEINTLDQASSKDSRPGRLMSAGRSGSNVWTWLPVLSVLAFAVLALFFYQGKRLAENQTHRLSAEFAAFREQCESQQLEQAEKEKIYAFLSDGRTRPVFLNGTELAPEAEAVVYWNLDERTGYLNLVNLPEPPPGKQYQIWADVDGEMINMGLCDFKKDQLQPVAFIDQAASFNITLEPAGGSDHPTVELLYVNGDVAG